MFKKNPGLWLAILLTLILIVASFLQLGFLESLELTTYDFRMKLRAGGPDTKTDVVLVDIDNDSITSMGRWPWPRSYVAEVVSRLKDNGAFLIGLDIIFSEDEKGKGPAILEKIKADFSSGFLDPLQIGTGNYLNRVDQIAGGIVTNKTPPQVKTGFEQIKTEFNSILYTPLMKNAQAYLQNLTKAQNDLNHDKKLADAIKKANNVVLPVFFSGRAYTAPDPKLPEVLTKNGLRGSGLALEYLIRTNKITDPVESFAQNARGLGYVNMVPDPDGTVRRETLLIDYKGLLFPSYALKTAMLAQSLDSGQIRVLPTEEGREGLQVGKVVVPTAPDQSFYITFTDSKAFPRHAFDDVYNGKVQAAAFRDKIVLIGVSADGVDTPRVTPLDNKMPSFVVVANVLQNLLDGGFIVRRPMMHVIELGILILLGVFLSLLLPRLKSRTAALASAGVLVLIVGAGIYLFVGPGLWFKITYPVLLVILGYAAVTTSRYFVTEGIKEKAEGESAEVNRMLGLSFQNQGQLDLAFDKFRRVPVDEGMKDLLYNLALDYERKRMFNKAVSVYEYIREHDAKYRDIEAKIKKLTRASETMIFGLGSSAQQAEDGSLMIDEDTKPTLGRYEIIQELGKGAMGIVYLGKDPQIGREMAIKTIRFTDEYEEEEAEKIKEQFFAEAKTAGMLSHPNIVTIYDAGTDHDLSFIAMELLDGYDLKEHARKDNLLSMREVIGLVADVADALGYAHGKGVVHRDIKPANIMYVKGNTPKVTDFGIARAMASSKTKTGVVKGTPFYMSPEQITGKKVDGRSDIFSLGVVLYELLTGEQPFKAEDLTSLIYKITSEEPDPVQQHNPKVPKAVVQIIDKALVKDRDKRYQKARQMADHLRIVGRKMDELASRKNK